MIRKDTRYIIYIYIAIAINWVSIIALGWAVHKSRSDVVRLTASATALSAITRACVEDVRGAGASTQPDDADDSVSVPSPRVMGRGRLTRYNYIDVAEPQLIGYGDDDTPQWDYQVRRYYFRRPTSASEGGKGDTAANGGGGLSGATPSRGEAVGQ